ncbi:MAG: transglycosylase domain-containing protein [Deltaproteobacteria bacterium]|nr:transglycosylase domain-containing protein [Deltaproteobacteria bacterium]
MRSLVWAELGGEGAPVLEPLNPYSYFSIALNPIEHAEASGSPIHMASPHRLAARAGRTLVPSAPELGGGMGRWHLTNVAATIWVSRNWSASRAIDHVAGTDYYGHGFVGLPAASAGYFGLEPTQLSPPHAAMLVVIPKRPGRFSPWCFYHANIEQASRLVVGPWPELKPAPPDTCRSFAAAQQEPTADAP